MRKFTKRSAAIATAAAVVIGGAGAAYAWTIGSGTGSTTVNSSTITPLSIAGATVNTELAPGITTDVKIAVSNLNKFGVNVDRAFISGVTTNKPACKSTDFTVNGTTDGQNKRFDFQAVAIGASSDGTTPQTATVTVSAAVKMNENAPDGCAGAVVTVNVSGVNAYVGTVNHA